MCNGPLAFLGDDDSVLNDTAYDASWFFMFLCGLFFTLGMIRYIFFFLPYFS